MNPKDQIKQTVSILDVVSTYVRLEKAGSQFKGRCPFHNEKSPSFFVSPDRGTYHCFGCSSHGDIFSFIEKMESIPFYEALTILADRAGIKLTQYKKEEKDKENNLINLLQKANRHYEKNLENSPEAKMYLADRGLDSDTIKKFNIGFSVGGESSWRDLFIALSKEGFSPEEMIAAGVIIKKESNEGDKYFDRFRGRIMFPIKNVFGNVVGFSARILPKFDDGKSGKYINSPETDIYHKSKILFGYDMAKKSIAEKREVILVEGQMDLIMSYQAGIENIVATSGTAVTDEHIKIIKRFADKVLLSFDQDDAGEKAMKRCALLSLFGGLDVFIIPKKDNVKDVADLVKEFGGEMWKELILNKKHIIEYFIDNIFSKIKDERERGIIVRKEVLLFLRAIESDIDRSYFIRYVADKLKANEIDIINDMKRVKIEDNLLEKKEEENKIDDIKISKKDKTIREILAILKWKEIEEDKFINKFLKDINKEEKDYLENLYITDFAICKENKIEEIIEQDILKIEREISKNTNYIENKKKFIDEMLFDLSKAFKIEILQEKIRSLENIENTDTDENLKEINIIYKEIHNLKASKF